MEGLGTQEQCWAEGRWRCGWRLFCHLRLRSDPEGEVNGVDGPSAPLPRCPPRGGLGNRHLHSALSWKAAWPWGPGPVPCRGARVPGAVPMACVKPRKAQGPRHPRALVDAGLVACAGRAGQKRALTCVWHVPGPLLVGGHRAPDCVRAC